jgi:hypothetical protein
VVVVVAVDRRMRTEQHAALSTCNLVGMRGVQTVEEHSTDRKRNLAARHYPNVVVLVIEIPG